MLYCCLLVTMLPLEGLSMFIIPHVRGTHIFMGNMCGNLYGREGAHLRLTGTAVDHSSGYLFWIND